ncbi:regulatory protein GemA [Sphingomonas sp. SRS2]|uniref:regulatory protein GemA n=1 Tax=Sphingomonas sp. SRS2 TaxID=133190 RepID=UPI0006971C9C|nr:regulatory protein GemA [Sphingomonas sp. SRS2]
MAKSFADLAKRQLRTTAGKSDSRNKLIGAVRAASKRLQLADDDRRAIQLEVVGKASMSDMTPGEIGKVLDRLNRDVKSPMAHRSHVGKIRALWWTLYWVGEDIEPNDAALDGFTRRQTGLAALRFVDHRHAPSIIEALKSWASRAGVRWHSDAWVADMARIHGPQVTRPVADRLAVIDAIWEKLRDAGQVYDSTPWSFVARAHSLGMSQYHWTAREIDTAIRTLGRQLRRHIGRKID